MPADRRLLVLLCALVIVVCGDDGDGGGGVGMGEQEAGGVGGLVLLLPPSSSSSSSLAEEDNATAGQDASHHPPVTTTAHTPASLVVAESPEFALRVQVKDMVTRQPLAGASVDVYVNHALRTSSVAGPRGEVLLRVPYSPGLRLVLLAAMDGYVPSPLPWTTSKRPIFSAVTILLLPHNQGNIWLFEDSVLITGKLPDTSPQPSVRFPRDLLALSEGANTSSLTAYVTVPHHHLTKDCANCTPGIISSGKSAYRSVELKAVAAISARLYLEGQELQVSGPIQITLPLGPSTNLRPADTVPAWAFNAKTGAWENQGLGMVKTASDGLVWSYTASHLGYWIAAPMPSSKSYMMGHGSSMEFLSYHTYLLVGILGGTLAIVIGFLSVLVCRCGDSHRETRGSSSSRRRRKARFSKLSVLKKDQTTSTRMEEGLLASRSVQCDPSSATPRHHKANYNIYVEDPGSAAGAPLYENLAPGDHHRGAKGPHHHQSSASHYVNNDEVARLRERSEQSRGPSNLGGGDQFFQDKLILIQAPELFGAPGEQVPPGGCKSATFPRNGGDYDPHSEPAGGEDFTQTLPKAPHHHHHHQGGSSPQRGGSQDEPQPLETPPPGSQVPNPAAWGRYNNLPESSVSVPGTLNEAAGMGGLGELQGISERTLLELARGGKSSASHPAGAGPRAWFVSLDGKPCAQVRHSVIELPGGILQGGLLQAGGLHQGGRHPRPPSSNDTSLDSGVDMSESAPQSLRDAYRDSRPGHSTSSSSSSRTSRASSLPSHHGRGRYDEQDLSSSESGTATTCTPEDPSLRNILDSSSGAIPNIPEERGDGADAWSSAQEDSQESRGTPPPRRLRKVREKGSSGGKRSAGGAKHVAGREGGRPLAKRS